MKSEMCKGCSNLYDRIQLKHKYSDTIPMIDTTTKIMKPFCRAYGLHLEYVEQIIPGNKICKEYY